MKTIEQLQQESRDELACEFDREGAFAHAYCHGVYHESEEPWLTLASSGTLSQEVLEGIATDSIRHAFRFSTKAQHGEGLRLLMDFHDRCAAWFAEGMPAASEEFVALLGRVLGLMIDLGRDVSNRALWAVFLREFSLLHMVVFCKSAMSPNNLSLKYDSAIDDLGRRDE